MNFECLKEKLEEAISAAGRASSKNTSLPVLEGVYLSAEKNKVIIRGTNLEVGVEIVIPARVLEQGAVVVHGDVLGRFLNTLPVDKKISVEKKKNLLSVDAGSVNTLINTFSAEDFPALPRLEKQTPIVLESSSFSEGLKSVWYSASPSSMKPELSSVYILNNGGTFVFAATDSFRLAEKRVFGIKSDSFKDALIPYKNVSEIIRFLEEGSHGRVEMRVAENQISFSTKNRYLTTRIIDGNFPDYKQIIPKEFITEVVVLKRDLLDALKTTNIFANKFNQIYFSINPSKKEFSIKTQNNEVGESLYDLKASLQGEGIEISFNFRYVTDCFQSIPQDSVMLKLSGVGKPMIICGVGDESFTYLVMPMNR